ncbi:MAG: PIN domain-containing protein [Dehalococcoidia bacterium]|nr:PIN domain-containing protein [Dehalococcoidia bacterium]
MSRDFLDASALLALIQDEPGADEVRAAVHRGVSISAVNFAEVVSKLVSLGLPEDDAVAAASIPDVAIVDLSADVATTAGQRHGHLRQQGISLADVICLESARAEGVRVLTADRTWPSVAPDVDILLIR